MSKVIRTLSGISVLANVYYVQLAADTDQAVKNGGELLDRLVKDIVIEQASTYTSMRPTTPDGALLACARTSYS